MRAIWLALLVACSSEHPSALGVADAVAGRECHASVWHGDERWRVCRYASPEHWCCVSEDTGEERACRLYRQATIDACFARE